MLKTKLFRGFVVLVVLYGVLAAMLAIRTIQSRVIEEAQRRVRLDLRSAWHVTQSELDEIETVLRIAATKQAVVDAGEAADWSAAELHARMERLRVMFGMDFFGIVSPDGGVVARASSPHRTGDFRVSDPVIASALAGTSKSGMAVMSADELRAEGDGLADRAFLEIKETRHARLTHRTYEDRGLVMMSAAPIRKGVTILGAVYGGVLVNRNNRFVDTIQDIVYGDELYKGTPVGTATIFLYDTRIATTVVGADGNRALATRVSKEVAEQVLDNGTPWLGEAFVVQDWHLSAYDPIRNAAGETIGMLYVGMLKQPFVDYGRTLMMRYVGLSVFVLAVALALAFFIAGRLSQPIHRLVEAANRTRKGERPAPVSIEGSCLETETLIHAFNQMTATLGEREESLRALNRSYMETLGFVSHELKSPVATMLNYVFLLREQKLGPLTEKQVKAIRVIDSNSNRLVEMVRHYLNLSRIENNELQPMPTRVDVRRDVLAPILDAFESDIAARAMRLNNRVADATFVHADLNMAREVFENLVSNAVKYGKNGGAIEIDARGEERGRIEFRVRNEGEGIAPERQGELFKKFSRLEGAQAVRMQKGTGLGLFITKTIVEAHGGSIRVESEPGHWAEFVFDLPAHIKEGASKSNA